MDGLTVTKRTEWLLQIAAGALIAYFGWQFAQMAILWPWKERAARMTAEESLQRCRAESVGKPERPK